MCLDDAAKVFFLILMSYSNSKRGKYFISNILDVIVKLSHYVWDTRDTFYILAFKLHREYTDFPFCSILGQTKKVSCQGEATSSWSGKKLAVFS